MTYSRRRSRQRRTWLPLLALLAALTAPAPAAAAARFLPAETVSTDIGSAVPCTGTCFTSTTPDVAMSPSGDAVAVWTEPEPPAMVNRKLRYSVRPAAGEWSVAKTIASGVSHALPRVTVDREGDATVVFARIARDPATGTTISTIEAAARPAGGSFGAPDPISDPASGPLLGFDMAANPDGDAVVSWAEGTDIKAATRTGDGAFGSGATLPGGPAATALATMGGPPAAIDERGNAIVLWPKADGTRTQLVASRKPAGGAFPATPDPITAGTGIAFPDVRFDADGDAVAVWVGASSVVHTASRPKGAGFGRPQPISAAGAMSPSLGVAADGRAIVAWARAGAGVETASRLARGSFGAPVPVAGTSTATLATLTLNRAGKGILVTSSGPGSLSARSVSVGGATAEPADLGPVGLSMLPAAGQATLDDQGNGAIALATAEPGTSPAAAVERVKVVGVDGAGPQLRSLSTPASGTAGDALGFSVRPVDVWSGVESTLWSFRDGGSAPGERVQHAYGAPGRYAATVTSSDGLGNRTTSSPRRVAVGPPRAPLAPADREDPVVGGASMLRRTFRVAETPTPIVARGREPGARKGSAFRFAPSEAASVSIRIERRTTGRRFAKRCAKPSKHNRRGKPCKRWAKSGELRHAAARGRNEVPFSGRIGSRALKPGAYRATLVATDDAGNESAPARVAFRIVR